MLPVVGWLLIVWSATLLGLGAGSLLHQGKGHFAAPGGVRPLVSELPEGASVRPAAVSGVTSPFQALFLVRGTGAWWSPPRRSELEWTVRRLPEVASPLRSWRSGRADTGHVSDSCCSCCVIDIVCALFSFLSLCSVLEQTGKFSVCSTSDRCLVPGGGAVCSTTCSFSIACCRQTLHSKR